jgi:hypothetical protein
MAAVDFVDEARTCRQRLRGHRRRLHSAVVVLRSSLAMSRLVDMSNALADGLHPGELHGSVRVVPVPAVSPHPPL